MKKLIARICCMLMFCCAQYIYSQQPGTKIEKVSAAPAGFVQMRDLPIAPPPALYQKKILDAPNPHKGNRFIGKTRPDPQDGRPSFNPLMVIPSMGNANPGNSAAPQIFESPCVTYQSVSISRSIPPDVSSAVGFDHIFIAVNDRFRITDKNNNVLLDEDEQAASGFWSTIDNTNLFDPVITYDPYERRWIFVIATDSDSPNSAFLIAVSQGPDPMGGWFFYRWDADGDNNQWFDYPSVGFNRNWIVVNGNVFQNTGSTAGNDNRTWVINKAQMYAGQNTGATVFTRTDYSTICPAKVYDPNLNDLWCVSNNANNDNDLRYFRIGGTAAAPTFTVEGTVGITGNWEPGNNNIGPQRDTSALIHCGDHDVLSAIWRNGRLYSAQTIFTRDGNNREMATIQLVIANPATPAIQEAIRFANSAASMYAFPCLAVNANDDIVISCSRFTNTIFASACVLVRRSYGGGVWTETLYKTGDDRYVGQLDTQNRLRWGDYTSAHVDPSDDQSVWLASEYATTRSGGFGQWGTWWAKICSGICNADVFMNTVQPANTMRKFEASVNVYASSQVLSGADIKLDAGSRIVLQPGFRANTGSKLRTYIEGCGGVQ